MAEARKHHYISQFYLRHFTALTTGTPSLFVVDKTLQRNFSTSTVNVAQERDFHRIDVIGYAPNAVEDALAKYEAEAANALSAILDRAYVGDDEVASVLMYYMALLLVKNPAMRTKVDQVISKIMTTIAKADAADASRFDAKLQQMIADGEMDSEVDVERLRQSILQDEHSISMGREGHLDLEFSNAKELMQFFVCRKWLLLRAKVGQFITCDRPVVLTRPNPGFLGLADPAVEILFPVSSGVAIFGGVGWTTKDAAIERAAVAEFNGKIAWNADRQVYARDQHFEYLGANGQIKTGVDLMTDSDFVSASQTE